MDQTLPACSDPGGKHCLLPREGQVAAPGYGAGKKAFLPRLQRQKPGQSWTWRDQGMRLVLSNTTSRELMYHLPGSDEGRVLGDQMPGACWASASPLLSTHALRVEKKKITIRALNLASATQAGAKSKSRECFSPLPPKTRGQLSLIFI